MGPGVETQGSTRGAALAGIAFDAPADVRTALESLGRTEDVRFAPSGRRLAIACYLNDRIAVADVEVGASGSGVEVAVTRLELLGSSSLNEPHGLDFLDEETLIVANRGGGIAMFRLPSAGSADGVATIEPLGAAARRAADGPGSVLVDSHDPERRWILACNNWGDTITRHAVEPGWTLGAAVTVAPKWLDLPDGLALSHDGRWLATSNHNAHNVLIHSYPTAGGDAEPVAVLRGVVYPHGIRFSADDRYLFVADGGRPYVQVFASPSKSWWGVRNPEATIPAMDAETFARGRDNPQEGGPKGIEVHPHTNVLVVTAECLPLAFFDVDAALEQAAPAETGDVLLQYELDLLKEQSAMKAAADRWLLRKSPLRTVLDNPRVRRVTKPLRAVKAGLRHLRSR